MTVCSKCGHGNDAGKDFCAECGEFLDWGDDPPAPVKRPAAVAAIGPTRAVAAAAAADDPAVREAAEDARVAGEEALRIRAEAERRASEATERAKRLATEEARGARKAAYSRAEQVVEMASMTAGGSQAEVAALVAQVRREAESKAQIEVGDAELRAARKARRAREEAHAPARAQAAPAEQKAKEASDRAVALIARAPSRAGPDTRPTPKVTEPVPVVPSSRGQTATAAGGANAVAPVKPVPASAPQWQPPAVTPEEVPVVNPGDVVCRTCTTANDPSRRFCRKCGGSLVFVPPPPSLTWSQRMRTWLQRTLARNRRRPGEPAQEAPAPGSSGPGMSMAGVTRGVLAVAAVAGIFLAIGPYRQEATADITSVRKRLVPRPSYIDGEVASAAPNATVIKTLTDKTLDPAPFTSNAVVGPNPPGPGAPPAFSVALGKDGDLTKAVNVFKVGIVGDTLGEHPPKHPSVHHLYIVAYGKDGQQEKAKSLTLHDDPSFQSFLFAVNHVARVDFFVLDTYASADRQGPYTIDQVEFFALT